MGALYFNIYFLRQILQNQQRKDIIPGKFLVGTVFDEWNPHVTYNVHGKEGLTLQEQQIATVLIVNVCGYFHSIM